MFRLIFLIFFCACILTIPVGFKRLTCGFKLYKMEFHEPFREEWEVTSNIDIQGILSQTFTYLNRGAQSYVFVSADNQYVIKFFRFDRLKEDHEQKINELFHACKLAYCKAKDETGILYLHLNQTKDQLPKMHIIGPLGQKISLSADDYRFVVQKKVTSFQDSILSLDPELVRKRLDSFIAILQSRLNKGIRNSDPAVIRNFGFLGDVAVEIDFGNYSEKPTSKEKEFAQYTGKLRAWLKENAPEWVEYFDAKLASN